MPWNARPIENPPAVEVCFSGFIPPRDLAAGALAAVELGAKTGTARYLADCRELEGGHNVFDVYGLVDLFDRAGVDRTNFREAVLFDSTLADERLQFYETVCHNRGYLVRLFRDRDIALEWLRS
jgi:hypothetical protein